MTPALAAAVPILIALAVALLIHHEEKADRETHAKMLARLRRPER